jgi:transcriptional regulator with XRE-family HTH domain
MSTISLISNLYNKGNTNIMERLIINMDNLSIGEKISLLRNRKGLSIRALSQKTGIHWVTIGKYEHSQMQPSVDALSKLAKFLEASLDYLVFDKKQIEITDKKLLSLAEQADALPQSEKNRLKNLMESYMQKEPIS